MKQTLIRCACATVIASVVWSIASLAGAEASVKPRPPIFQPVVAENGMVSSQESLATRVGVEVLRRGGNAVDAAVAVGFALAVTLPRAGNLGGGGFMMVHQAELGKTHAIDYRETAPGAASRDMLLDNEGNYDRRKAIGSHLAVGVPGTVAGLTLALERFGTMPLVDVMQPAIDLAEEGIPVTQGFAESMTPGRVKRLSRWPASREKFFKSDGMAYQIGDKWRQPMLARSLKLIAERGASAFYNGEVAERIVVHLATEAMKFAYADRSWYLGDPAFWKVPVDGLTSKAYAAEIRRRIDPDTARTADEIGPGDPKANEGRNTTHYSVIDRHGNVVSNTYTLNLAYGTGIVVPGTGILLNNEMDDFSAKLGVPNSYGLIGGVANAIEAGKRPLSSMTPTIVFKDGKPLLVTGSPGGSRIITAVLQVISNIIDHGMNVAAATAAPRFHHQWRPDALFIEPGFSADTVELLKRKGQVVRSSRPMGSTQSIMAMPDGLTGASDPRRRGALTAGY